MPDPLDLAPAQRLSREIRFRARYGELMDRCSRYVDAGGPSGFVRELYWQARASARLTPAQADALTRALDEWDARQ